MYYLIEFSKKPMRFYPFYFKDEEVDSYVGIEHNSKSNALRVRKFQIKTVF